MQGDDVAVDYRIETANEMIVVGSFKENYLALCM
jgi:hypothetical protein